MKRIISLMLVFILLIGGIPVFAESMTYGEQLFELGLIKGDQDGNLNETNTLNRAEMMVILSRLYGEEEEALNFILPSSFTDVDKNAWYSPYVAYAQFKGWTKGYGDGTFGPLDTLTDKQAATFLLRTLGYNDPFDFEYVHALTFAHSFGINAMITNGNAVKRGEVFELMFDTIHTFNKDGVILGEALGVFDPEPSEIDVVSIVASNLKEVVITYNVTVDKATAEDEGNYTLDGYTFNAELQSDGRKVILILNDNFENQEEFELEIDGIESDEGGYILEDYESGTLQAFDVTIPAALSIELKNPTTFEIEFSEPIDSTKAVDVEIENDIYSINSINQDGSAIVEIVLSTELPSEDDYEVVVSDAYDYAGLKAPTKSLVLEYVEDTDAPEATIGSANESEVVLQFNEDVFFYDESDNLASSSELLEFFYHSYSSYKPTEVTIDENEVTLDFTNNPLPTGSVKIVVVFNAEDGYIQDSWDNVVDENIILYATVEADDTPPTVTKIITDTDDPNTFEIYFSEEVLDSTNEDNYVIEDEENEEVEIYDIDYYSDDDEFYVEIETVDPIEGDCSIEISGVTDISVSENTIVTVTKNFTKEDELKPSLADVEAEYINGDNQIFVYVTFPEEMSISGSYSILNKNNYVVDGYSLDGDDTVKLFGGRDQVKITIDDTFTLSDGNDLEIARMADEAGNLSAELHQEINMYEVESLEISSAKTIDKSHLEIIIDGELDVISVTGFEVENNGSSDVFASIAYSVIDGETKIIGTLKVDQQLTSSSDLPDSISIIADVLKDDKGRYMDAANYTVFEDGYKPSLVGDEEDYMLTTLGVLELEFTESVIEVGSDGTAAFDFEIELNGEILTKGTDFTAYDTSGNITIDFDIDLDAGDDVIINVDDSIYIEDSSGNTINDFSLELEVLGVI
jgi:hypothetical protein